MQYMLLIHGDESMWGRMTPEEGNALMGAYLAYTESMKSSGAFVSGEPLQPAATGTLVRVQDGKPQVLDGPYAETKEQLGGFYVIDVPSLDAAIEWAARCPGASHGTMEVRPVMSM